MRVKRGKIKGGKKVDVFEFLSLHFRLYLQPGSEDAVLSLGVPDDFPITL